MNQGQTYRKTIGKRPALIHHLLSSLQEYIDEAAMWLQKSSSQLPPWAVRESVRFARYLSSTSIQSQAILHMNAIVLACNAPLWDVHVVLLRCIRMLHHRRDGRRWLQLVSNNHTEEKNEPKSFYRPNWCFVVISPFDWLSVIFCWAEADPWSVTYGRSFHNPQKIANRKAATSSSFHEAVYLISTMKNSAEAWWAASTAGQKAFVRLTWDIHGNRIPFLKESICFLPSSNTLMRGTMQ